MALLWSVILHALDAVLNLLVQLLKQLQVVLARVPVATSVGLEEGGDLGLGLG